MTGHPEDRTERERLASEAVAGLAPVRPDPEFRQRLAKAFVEGTIPERAAGPDAAGSDRVVPLRRPAWHWWLGAAAAAVVIVGILMRSDTVPHYALLDGSFSGTAMVDGRPVPLEDLRDRGLPAGARVTVTEGALDLRWDDVVAVRIHPGEILLSDPYADGESPWRLARGEAIFQTGPGFPGSRLTVLTPEGRVEVVGTSLAVYRDSMATCVCVLEGTASVGLDRDDLEPVPPGQRKVMYADGSAPEILDIMPAHRDGLLAFVERARASLAGERP